MKIHSDTLTTADLYRHVPAGCYLEADKKGSRSRSHGFDVHMSAARGADRHGIARCFTTNSGTQGAGYERAATYIEWGDWMVSLFKVDPAAIVGPYKGAADFVRQTREFAPHRPKREDAIAHADRWADELEAALGVAGVPS